MSELDGAVRSLYENDRASQALGIDVLEVDKGRARARMQVTAQMVNGHGIAHGGYLFLLADSTFAFACNSHGPATVASGAEVSFIAPARIGDRLVAVAEERITYGRNGICDVTVYRDGETEPEVVAEFRGRSRRIQRETRS